MEGPEMRKYLRATLPMNFEGELKTRLTYNTIQGTAKGLLYYDLEIKQDSVQFKVSLEARM